MRFGSVTEDLPIFIVLSILVTGACLGTSMTLGAEWIVLPFFVDSFTWFLLGTSLTGL
jgi:hypothetical protein